MPAMCVRRRIGMRPPNNSNEINLRHYIDTSAATAKTNTTASSTAGRPQVKRNFIVLQSTAVGYVVLGRRVAKRSGPIHSVIPSNFNTKLIILRYKILTVFSSFGLTINNDMERKERSFSGIRFYIRITVFITIASTTIASASTGRRCLILNNTRKIQNKQIPDWILHTTACW